MRIAVLGASGVVGRSFVPLAGAAGHALFARRTDIFDRDALTALVTGCDAVVNLAISIPKAGGGTGRSMTAFGAKARPS